MNSRLIISFFLFAIIFGCATITTPTGGPKDAKKPYITVSIPTDNSKNFSGKSVILTFDEPVKLNNPKDEIIISPSPGKREITVRGNAVTITPENGWLENTTYSIFPREGIQDITESNPADSSKLAFSTGPEIDSMFVFGKITNLLTGSIPEKITVGLYQQDTFDIFSDTSRYFTKADKKGRFKIENIKPSVYKIYAFDDKNKNLRIDSRTEKFGYLLDSIDLRETSINDSIKVGLMMLDSRPLKITTIRNTGILTRLRFNKASSSYTIQTEADITHAYGDNQAEVLMYVPPESTDSLKVTFHATDSILSTLDSTFYVKKNNIKLFKTEFKTSLGKPTLDSETLLFKTVMSFNKPINTINFDSIYIQVDTTSRISITKDDITIDPVYKILRIEKKMNKELIIQPKDSTGKELPSPQLTLRVRNNAFLSIEGDSSKRISEVIPVTRYNDTGTLLIELQTDEKDFIIELLTRDFAVVRTLRNEKKYTFKNLTPGDYQIRITVDTNKNGKWDPGSFVKHIAPEQIIFYKTSQGRQSVPLRANWELGPLIIRF